MLVLTRKQDEQIVIRVGDEVVTVKVIRTGRYTKIGVDAPKDMQIMRGEVWDNRMTEEQIAQHVAWYGGRPA